MSPPGDPAREPPLLVAFGPPLALLEIADEDAGAVAATGFALIAIPENIPPDGTFSDPPGPCEGFDGRGPEDALIALELAEIFEEEVTGPGEFPRTGGAYGGGGGAASPFLNSLEKNPLCCGC